MFSPYAQISLKDGSSFEELQHMATLSGNTVESLKDNKHNVNIKNKLEDCTVEMSNMLLLQDMVCDSCIDSPTKALRFCLTCLIPYCESHFRAGKSQISKPSLSGSTPWHLIVRFISFLSTISSWWRTDFIIWTARERSTKGMQLWLWGRHVDRLRSQRYNTI